MEFQDLKNGKEVKPETHYEVWCMKCKTEGHHKDKFPIFQDYITTGGPNPLKPESLAGSRTSASAWYSIFQVLGQHSIDNYYLF